jgi:site-specific DNA-cytosine methylase
MKLQQDEHDFQHTSSTDYPSWPNPHSHWSATDPRNQLLTLPTRERRGTPNLESTDQHRSDRWAPPVRPVPAGETWRLPQKVSTLLRPMQHTGQTGLSKKAPKHQTGLPSSKLTQTRNSSNTEQQQTHPNVHLRQIPQVTRTGKTGQEHRSDRCGLGSSRWTAPAGQPLQIQTSISWIAPRTWKRLWG